MRKEYKELAILLWYDGPHLALFKLKKKLYIRKWTCLPDEETYIQFRIRKSDIKYRKRDVDSFSNGYTLRSELRDCENRVKSVEIIGYKDGEEVILEKTKFPDEYRAMSKKAWKEFRSRNKWTEAY